MVLGWYVLSEHQDRVCREMRAESYRAFEPAGKNSPRLLAWHDSINFTRLGLYHPGHVTSATGGKMKGKLLGVGLIAGATWGAYNRLRKPASLKGSYANAPTKILILGGGFGGLAAARALARTLSGSEDV